jgi:hypothetical protein
MLLIPFGYSQDTDEALDLIVEAYQAIKIAEEKGADIEGLVDDLNIAIGIIKSGDNEGLGQISDILDKAIQAQNQGEALSQLKYLRSGLLTGLTFALVYLVWRFGSSLYLKIWVRTKGDWSVTR